MNSKDESDYKELEQEAIKQFQHGLPLLCKNGGLVPLLKRLLEAGLQGELQDYVEEEKPPLPLPFSIGFMRKRVMFQRSLSSSV